MWNVARMGKNLTFQEGIAETTVSRTTMRVRKDINTKRAHVQQRFNQLTAHEMPRYNGWVNKITGFVASK